MKKTILILLAAAYGCGGIAAADLASIGDIANNSAMGYHEQEAGTRGAALDRGTYCAASSILRRNLPEGGVPDAGIVCQ